MSARKMLIGMLVLAALCALTAQAACAFATQGIVTGRIYNDMNSNDTAMNDFKNMGVGWIRIEFEEFMNRKTVDYTDAAVQAEKVKYQNIIAKAHARGISVLGVCGWNSFRTTSGNMSIFPDTDASLDEYRVGVKWHADNYSIDAVEIWNEPTYWGSKINFGYYGAGGADNHPRLARYAQMLINVYSYMKGYKPAIKIVGPATANAESGDWINGAYAGDYANSIFNSATMRSYRNSHSGNTPMDAVSWHPYGTSGPPDSGNFYFGAQDFPTYYTNILAYRDRDNRLVIGSKDIWFTEYGWNSSGTYHNWQTGQDIAIGQENQRIWQEKIIAMIYARSQVKLPFWYDYRDDEAGGSEACGLLLNSGGGYAKKRVYYAFFAHSCLVGLATGDGYSEWPRDQIIDRYLAWGAKDGIGSPFNRNLPPLWYGDKVHYWGPSNNGMIQFFTGGANTCGGECCIGGHFNNPNAFTIKCGFYSMWVQYSDGPWRYGWPTSDEFWDGSQAVQWFEFGHMTWDSQYGVRWWPN